MTIRPGAPLAFALVAGLAGMAVPAFADVVIVTANPDMTFTPSNVVIKQGDTINFRNAGGLHNVHADDGRFICSLNCTTNNAPSTEPWSVMVQFNRVGTIGYYCEAHGDLNGGMRGSVTVIDSVFADGFDGRRPH